MIDGILTVSVLMSFLGFVLMMLDKSYAKGDKTRISERTFALITLFGGIIGIILGSLFFSHKTKKRSFQFKIVMMFAFNILLVFIIVRSMNV